MSAVFSASTNYLEATLSSPIGVGTDRLVTAWVKYTGASQESFRVPMELTGSGGYMRVQMIADTGMGAYVGYAGSGNPNNSNNTPLVTGTWTPITIFMEAVDGGYVFYGSDINGTTSGGDYYPTSPSGVFDLIRLGQGGIIDSFSNWKGKVAEVAVWSAPSFAAMQAIFDQHAAGTRALDITGATPVWYADLEADDTATGGAISMTGTVTYDAADNPFSSGDTTAPTLTTATGTATGSTTATGTVTTDEANGTLYRLASTNATETAATVVAAALSQSVTTTGSQAVSFTGLTASTTYYAHYVHDDAASNRSARVSSSSFTTSTPDTTAPTLSSPTASALSNALIAAGVTTNEANGTLHVVATTSATPPTATQIRAGQDHTGAAAVFDDSQVISSTGAKTFNVTGLTQLTLYYLYFHHQDAAANNSTVSSASATTFRNGATAQSVIDNTAAVGGNQAGVLYALALTLDPDDWMAYREISAPDPAGGTLTPNANGSFTYVGPEPADWVIQPEVNGVDHADGTITVALYQTIVEDTTAPTLTSPTGATLGPTGAVGSVSTNEANGTLYWLTNTSATATDAAIKAANSQAVTATGVQNVTSSGLTASTVYYNHFLHRDAAGNDSTRSTSASFTTAAPGGPVTGNDHGGVAMRSCMRPAMYPAMNEG